MPAASSPSPRHRRLVADLHQMNQVADQVSAISFRADGDPPEVYDVMFNAVGLARDDLGDLTLRRIHRCTVYLHSDYPRRPPVLTWLTPIFHPNILPPERNGGVCLGAWSASEGLGDLVRRVLELVCYRSFNIADALDTRAASWVALARVARGSDLAAVVRGAGYSADTAEAVSIAPRQQR
jgi:ubiquitin-protein ligase